MRFDDTPAAEIQIARDERRFSIGIPMREVSFRTMIAEMVRVIDERPCEPLLASDCEWGEQDDGSQIPRGSKFRSLISTEEQDDA